MVEAKSLGVDLMNFKGTFGKLKKMREMNFCFHSRFGKYSDMEKKVLSTLFFSQHFPCAMEVDRGKTILT